MSHTSSEVNVSSLDPRAPFVLDIRELGRRAGAMKTQSFSVAAPADLRLGTVGVPAESEIEFDLKLESVMDGVLVTGTALVTVTGECARCLEPLSFDLEVDVTDLFVYPETDSRGRVISEDDFDEDLPQIEADLIDLEPLLRDAVVLALPAKPLCQPDCLGLCIECGANLNLEPNHQHPLVDPRWSALADLTTQERSTED